MGWPLSQDYNEAVQAPRTSFGDPDLKGGDVVLGPMGLPLPRSGNFADVYQVRAADGRTWAVKCFTRPVGGLKDRYARIDEHLQEARLPFTVGFRFLSEGIRVRGQWYPVLKMEWVEGFTLNEFVRQHAGRPDMLRAMLGMWVRLCKRLRDSEIAHADLQHGNVLLVPGESANKLKLRLIDYDGMWIPELAGKPSGEAGHPAYQHPARLRDRIYSADVDRFPHLAIGCALRALAVAGKPMFDQFDNGDNLLFREPDFAHPEKSKLLRVLWDLDDPTVTNLVALLVVSSQRPVRDTPWLDELLEGEKAQPVSDAVLGRAASILGVPRRAARKAAPPAQIYVVPEEANAFANLMDDADAPRRPRRRRRKRFPFIPVMAGGGIVAAAGIVVAILATRNKPDDPPGAGTSGTTLSIVAGSGTGADLGKGGPVPVVKRGTLETKWAPVESGNPVSVAALAEGLDRSKAATFLRPYAIQGAGSLGAWFRPDGARTVLANRSGIGVLDLRSGMVEPLVTDLTLVRAAVSPDGRTAVVIDKERTVRAFDVETGKPLFARVFSSEQPALAITPDGKRIGLTAEGVGYAEWALPEGTEIRRHESLQAAALAYSPDGKKAVALSKQGAVELWDLDDGTARLVGADTKATAVTVSADGTRALATTTEPSREIRAWSFATGRSLPARPLPVHHPVTILTVAANGTPVIGTEGGEVAFVPDGASSQVAFVAEPPTPITGISLTADGKHLVASTERANAYLSRIVLTGDGSPTPKLGPKNPSPYPAPPWLEFVRAGAVLPEGARIAISPRENRFLIATNDRVAVYDIDSFRPGDSFKLADGKIAGAGFGPGNSIVLCEADKDGKFRTRAWDLKTGEAGPTFKIAPPPGNMVETAIDRIVPVPNRPWVLVFSGIVGVALFDTATGEPVEGWPQARPLEEMIAAPSPDGRSIAFGSASRPVSLWDCDTATFRRPCDASTGFQSLAFTQDGRHLLGMGRWGRLRLWDVGTGKVVREVDHEFQGMFVEAVPIGNELAAVRVDRDWLVMNLTSGKVAGTGEGMEVPLGPGLAMGRRGWILARAPDNRLAAWKVLSEQAASAPAARPRLQTRWPDAKYIRDSARALPVGLVRGADGNHFYSATSNGHITRYSTDRLRFENAIETDDGMIRGMALTGGKLFTLGRKSLRVRDTQSLETLAEYPVTIAGSNPVVFAVHPDGNTVLISSDRIRELNLNTKKETVITPPRAAAGKPLSQFVWSRDGKVGAARWGQEITTVWHPRQTTETKAMEDRKSAAQFSPQGLAISEDGERAALGSLDGELRIWDTRTGKVLVSEAGVFRTANGDAVSIESIQFLGKGTHLLAAGGDGRMIAWKVDGFTKVAEFKGPAGSVRMVVGPDGRTVVRLQSQIMQLMELPDVSKSR